MLTYALVCSAFTLCDQPQNSSNYSAFLGSWVRLAGVSLFGKFRFATLDNSPAIACES